MTDVRTLLARNMKRCRDILDLSQADLADKVGCSTATIARIETYERFPSAETLDAIAAALEIHPSELFMEDSAAIRALQSKYEVREKLGQKVMKAIDEALDGDGARTEVRDTPKAASAGARPKRGSKARGPKLR